MPHRLTASSDPSGNRQEVAELPADLALSAATLGGRFHVSDFVPFPATWSAFGRHEDENQCAAITTIDQRMAWAEGVFGQMPG